MRQVSFVIMLISVIAMSGCASTQQEMDHIRYAAAEPVRDVNLFNDPIPEPLQRLQNPYGYSDARNCSDMRQEIAMLEQSIAKNSGRRVGFRRDPGNFEGRFGNLRDVGVKSAATVFIPFREVVRQVSGASRFELEAERASDQARYRVGYLVGKARAARCPEF